MTLSLHSPVFNENERIPAKYTCEGSDISPALTWSGIPQGTQSLVLIVDDPDAPDPKAPKMTYVHWVLYNIPAITDGLEEGVKKEALSPGTLQGINDWKQTGYGGPCPPIGVHRYFFKLYALDTVLSPLSPATKSEVEKAMQGHILEQAVLMGTYVLQKPK